MYDNVRVEREDRVATVTVDRPEKRNAMDIPTRTELRSAFESAVDDEAVAGLEGGRHAAGDNESQAE